MDNITRADKFWFIFMTLTLIPYYFIYKGYCHSCIETNDVSYIETNDIYFIVIYTALCIHMTYYTLVLVYGIFKFNIWLNKL